MSSIQLREHSSSSVYKWVNRGTLTVMNWSMVPQLEVVYSQRQLFLLVPLHHFIVIEPEVPCEFYCFIPQVWLWLAVSTVIPDVYRCTSWSSCHQYSECMFSEESWVYCAWYIFLFWHIVFLSTSIGWVIPECLWNSIIFNVVNWNFPKSQKYSYHWIPHFLLHTWTTLKC